MCLCSKLSKLAFTKWSWAMSHDPEESEVPIPYSCNICGIWNSNKADLMSHSKNQDPENIRTFFKRTLHEYINFLRDLYLIQLKWGLFLSYIHEWVIESCKKYSLGLSGNWIKLASLLFNNLGGKQMGGKWLIVTQWT